MEETKKMLFHLFKHRFNSVAKADILCPSDILDEAIHWTKGMPKKIVESCLATTDNPQESLDEMWAELNVYYGLKITTIEERVKVVSSKAKIDKNSIDAHILLMTELKALRRDARTDNIVKKLDRPDIIREIIQGRIPYMLDSFYEKEARISSKRAISTSSLRT